MTGPSSWGNCGALGGTRTPNLLIRRSMESVRPVLRNPESQVSVLLGVGMDAIVPDRPSSL